MRKALRIRLFVAAGLVFGVFVVTESVSVFGVEAYGDVSRVLFAEHVFEREAESEHRRGVDARRSYAGIAHKSVVSSVDECVCVE